MKILKISKFKEDCIAFYNRQKRLMTVLFGLLTLLLCVSCGNDDDGLTVYYNTEIVGQITYSEDNIPVKGAQIIVLAYFPYNKITGGRDGVRDTFYTNTQGLYYPNFLQRIGNDYVVNYWIDVTTNDTSDVCWIKGDEMKYGSFYLWVDSIKKAGYVLPVANLGSTTE